MKDLSPLEQAIGFTFKDSNLLAQALVHRSYLNENRTFPIGHNERLEFLGDAVLELAITDHLYRTFPDKTEGEMTALRSALVNTVTLSEIGAALALSDYLYLSRGESKDTGRARQYILANTVEALIGALYLDQGYEAAAGFVSAHVIPRLTRILEEGTWIDAKSLFQEKAQGEFSATPQYRTLKETGPDHDKRFVVGVYVKNEQVGEGYGDSKQDAEQDAARAALRKSGWL